MTITMQPGPVSGTVAAIPSKSVAHRLLLCAALADKPTTVVCGGTSQDIDATIRCLVGLGAQVEQRDGCYVVTPIAPGKGRGLCRLPCGESGSTLRFLLPVAGALGADAVFQMAGRLGQRPMEALENQLQAQGCRIIRDATKDRLEITGHLRGGVFRLPGDVSSQFISGLLFALPLLGEESRLIVEGELESVGYIDLTLQALSAFGVRPVRTADGWTIPPVGYVSPGTVSVEGDWSNAAPWLCMGTLGGEGITVAGMDADSRQGDRAIGQILISLGAEVTQAGPQITAHPARLLPGEIDARNVPDLVPVLAALAAAVPGETKITGAARLRLKESDRLETTAQTLNALGGQAEQTQDGLIIQGKTWLTGGTVDAAGDHRIAMAAAVASVACTGPVTVTGAQAVKKSYPTFWAELAALGKSVDVVRKEGETP